MKSVLMPFVTFLAYSATQIGCYLQVDGCVAWRFTSFDAIGSATLKKILPGGA